ncbi:SpoIIE family protein phosphatase [bacterium]|nr:SpoIIE family protein phosphatase [bacterium]
MTQDKIDLRGTKILVVDDVSANINVVYEALTPEGYDILAAPSGEVALKIAPRAKPDLILLDIMMPSIDGFETCRRLKGNESTADIPIIFITAKSETESIVEGFQLGGVDYIIKPFQHEEVRARVRTHLTIKRLQDGLKEANDRLREANKKIAAQKQAAEQELQDALQVQMSLLPRSTLQMEALEIAGKCVPANTVSGDFFDYLERPHEVALVIADVTGKAMKGAMHAVMTDGILRATAIEQREYTPASLMMTLNNVLKVRMEQYMNVTMVIGAINADKKSLTLANAGHHAYPILLRNSDIQLLKVTGMPLGMMGGIQYTEKQFPLESGDILILMTDGIIEAQDSEGKMYSESEKLEETISQFTPDMSASAMVDTIIADAIDFGVDKAQRDAKNNARLRLSANPNARLRLTDDMTVVVAKIQ